MLIAQYTPVDLGLIELKHISQTPMTLCAHIALKRQERSNKRY